MIEEILFAIAVYLVCETVIMGIAWCINLLSHEQRKKKCKEWLVNVDLTSDDRTLIERNRELLRELFPDGNIGHSMKEMSREDRVRLMLKLTEEAARNYDVEVDSVKIAPGSEMGYGCYGFYSYRENMIVFNQDMVCCDNPDVLREIVDTVFHELRHAQQYRAVTDSDYEFGSQEQKQRWALNYVEGNYIPADVDFELYQKQTIEEDARAVAAATMMDF